MGMSDEAPGRFLKDLALTIAPTAIGLVGDVLRERREERRKQRERWEELVRKAKKGEFP